MTIKLKEKETNETREIPDKAPKILVVMLILIIISLLFRIIQMIFPPQDIIGGYLESGTGLSVAFFVVEIVAIVITARQKNFKIMFLNVLLVMIAFAMIGALQVEYLKEEIHLKRADWVEKQKEENHGYLSKNAFADYVATIDGVEELSDEEIMEKFAKKIYASPAVEEVRTLGMIGDIFIGAVLIYNIKTGRKREIRKLINEKGYIISDEKNLSEEQKIFLKKVGINDIEK